MSPLNFSSIGICVHILWPKVLNVQKDNEEENEEITLKFCSLVSQD